MLTVRKKWRPSMVTLITMVVGTLIALPLIGLLAARLTSNQFVRETESSLISQAGIMAQVYAAEYRAQSDGSIKGRPLSEEQLVFYGQKFHHKPVSLTTKAETILAERPDPAATTQPIDALYQAVGRRFTELSNEAQKTSLAGYQAVDINGTIIGGTAGLKGSFADIPEIQTALAGDTVSLLRYRSDKNRRHPLVSISRDTGFRVMVAMPVIVQDHIVGAVYLTRTPSNLRSFLYRERQTMFWVAGSILLAAFVVGLLLWRLLAGPIRELQAQSEKVAKGQTASVEPIGHYGTKETAALGQSIVSMSTKLKQRSDSMQSYTAHVTHELKSPLTSIIGAIELLEQSGDRMGKDARAKFYQNIQADGRRMTQLLDDLRSLAAADMVATVGMSGLQNALEQTRKAFPNLDIQDDSVAGATLPIGAQDLNVVLTHLAQNALQNDATALKVSTTDSGLTVHDNGQGISTANLDKIFQPFFTTHRDEGGTGMGLAIVQSTLGSYNGTIHAEKSDLGAKFVVSF